MIEQRNYSDAKAGEARVCDWVSLRDSLADSGHFGLRLTHGRARFQTPDHPPGGIRTIGVFLVPSPVGSHRLPQLNLFGRKVKVRGHHTDYAHGSRVILPGCHVSIELQRLANDGVRAAETPLPKRIAQNGHVLFALLVFGRERATPDRTDSQHWKQICGDELGIHSFKFLLARQSHRIVPAKYRHLRERLALTAPVSNSQWGSSFLMKVALRIIGP